ncbi:MAG: cytochrome b N-terminal domain-containing protein [Verrucomicrobia bacterium]|nr:cytochrome b N-terminal domain-containing protein [Verrucomicrobiota bacterium]
MINALRNVANWFERRLHIVKLWEQTAGHPVPKSTGSWFYTFGSMTTLCLVLQLITGILLALVYIPSAAESYRTLDTLNYVTPLGWFMRGMHYWGSNMMVVMMVLHMTQVFLWGAYKYPRELTWISGCILLLTTLGMAFTGQVMRWDADAYWGVGIGAAILGRIPFIGGNLVSLLLGGPIIGSETLSRFFALHVFVIPGTLLALLAVHLRLVLGKGINEVPEPGVLVRRQTYDTYYKRVLRDQGAPFVPDVVSKDLVANGLLLIAIVCLALFVGPKGPAIPANPTLVISEAKPDYPFLWLLSAAALLPNGSEIWLFFVMPAVGVTLLILLPFISGEGEKNWRRRPLSIFAVILVYVTVGMLTGAGFTGPWSPHMEAWSQDVLPAGFVKDRSPLELAGAVVFQNKQCRNCHRVGPDGGHRGPDLTSIGTRMTQPQLVRQVIQGGGNMPAYGRTISQEEVTALVAYLSSLHPPYERPARDPEMPPNGDRKGEKAGLEPVKSAEVAPSPAEKKTD